MDLSPPRRPRDAQATEPASSSSEAAPKCTQRRDLSPPRRGQDVGSRDRGMGRHESRHRQPSEDRHGSYRREDRDSIRTRSRSRSPSRHHDSHNRHASHRHSTSHRTRSRSPSPLTQRHGQDRHRPYDGKQRPSDSSTASGREETIVRDKSGRKLDLLEEKRRLAELAAKEDATKKEAERWGRGIAQEHAMEAKRADLAAIASQPFARTKDDAQLNAMQADQVRWDDPMKAHAMKHAASVSQDPGNTQYAKQVCPFPAPPNRYGISPGPKWDGVDRSNGFELRYLAAQNKKKLESHLAYKYGSADM